MPKPTISVIVTCFNESENMIMRCIKSILGQTYTDFEIIIIDDGSDNKLRNFLDSTIQKEDDRILVFHEKNAGVSHARNVGMKIAKGQYITFIDADDVIESFFLEESYKIICLMNVPILMGGVIQTTNPEQIIRKKTNPAIRVYSKKQIEQFRKYLIGETYRFDTAGGYIGKGPVSKLVKAELAKSISFPEDLKIGEDNIWNLELINKAESLCIVEQIWYKYYKNPKSATRKYNPEIIKQCEDFLKILKRQIKNEPEEQISYGDRILSLLKNNIFQGFIGHPQVKGEKRKKRIALKYIYNNFPWKEISKREYISKANKKNALKALMYKTRVLFAYWKLKQRISDNDLCRKNQ